jgi:tetratricopeptide (TPR) repeat protein
MAAFMFEQCLDGRSGFTALLNLNGPSDPAAGASHVPQARPYLGAVPSGEPALLDLELAAQPRKGICVHSMLSNWDLLGLPGQMVSSLPDVCCPTPSVYRYGRTAMDMDDDWLGGLNGASPERPTGDRREVIRWIEASRDARASGALDLAAEALANAINLETDPCFASRLWDDLGHVRWVQKRYDEAIEAFRESIFRDGMFPGPWHDIAQIRLAQGDGARALEAIKEAIRRNPRRAKYWNTRGVIEARLERLAESVTSLERHLQLEPRSAAGLANLGLTYLRQGRYADARAACEKALSIDPSMVNLWITIGTCHAVQGDLASARQDFRKATDLDPRAIGAWFNLTLADARTGNLEAARETSKTLEALDQDSADEVRRILRAEGRDLGYE